MLFNFYLKYMKLYGHAHALLAYCFVRVNGSLVQTLIAKQLKWQVPFVTSAYTSEKSCVHNFSSKTSGAQ